jgi:hypothetical protein
MPPVGFEPAITGSERIQTHALDRASTEAASSSIIDCMYNADQFTAPLTIWRLTATLVVVPHR